MVTVSAEQDRVVLALSARGRDLILAPDQAERLAEEMDRCAGQCEAWVAAGGACVLLRGGTRGARVASWDGRVNVRLDAATEREAVPYEAARKIAAEIRAKATEAAARLQIRWQRN